MKLYSHLRYIVITLMDLDTFPSMPFVAFGIPHFLNDFSTITNEIVAHALTNIFASLSDSVGKSSICQKQTIHSYGAPGLIKPGAP